MTARSRHAVEACALKLQEWNPFHRAVQNLEFLSMPYSSCPKRYCRSDRSTVPAEISADLSKLSLAEDPMPHLDRHRDGQRFHLLERKRRRHTGSRSVSGMSSDRSSTRRTRRCCSVGGGAAYATCSDFPVAAGGTDSSGELFMNGDGSWGSDASEKKVSKRELKDVGGSAGFVERDGLGFSLSQGWPGVCDLLGNESGYGSETGYKGDAEVGYEDEFDEEEDDGRLLFWGDPFGDIYRLGHTDKNAFPDLKSHQRCRRKKNF